MNAAEQEFESFWRSKGKAAFLHRVTDAAEVFGMNKGRPVANVKRQPADYIVVWRGTMFWAEVKSTEDDRAFKFSLIRSQQLGAAKQTVTAGGQYWFFVKAPTGWFQIPAAAILSWPTKSMRWADIETYKVAL